MERSSSDIIDNEEEIRAPVNERASKPGGYFLELALLFLFIGNNLIQTLLQNQMIKQTCLQLGYNYSICNVINQNKNDTKPIEEQIQPYIANIDMILNIFKTTVPAILSLFLGNWSDLYGRKNILFSTFLGYTLTISSFAVVCYISDFITPLPAWVYIICYIPATISGGWPSLLTASLCYITDICEQSQRAKRLTIIELIIFLGVLIGTFSCASILAVTDATTVFVIAATFAGFALFVVVFLVDESVNVTAQDSKWQKAKNLFSPVILVNLSKTCFKRRQFKGRQILLLLMSIMALLVFTFNGTSTVGYLFVREKFSWTLEQNNLYDSYSIICSLIGSFIGFSVLKRCFKFSDMSLTNVALFSGILDSSLKALAFESWHMYAITSLSMFRVLASPMCRTLIANVIPHDEIGKIFSITTSYEALSTFISSPLYTQVYKNTFTTFPGAIFLITAGFNVLNMFIAIYIVYLRRIRESLINPYVRIETS